MVESDKDTGGLCSREGWASGPWDGEPDRLEWVTAAGYVGLIVRGTFGALCGYVGVPEGHPAYGKEPVAVPVLVHGGLTYTGLCDEPICHAADASEGPVYWLGFDCSHGFDVSPAMDAFFERALPASLCSLRRAVKAGVYRDIGYVRAEVERLAAQLAAMAGS